MSSEPYVPDEDVIENAYVDAHLDDRRGGIPAQVSSAEFRRGIAKIKADALRDALEGVHVMSEYTPTVEELAKNATIRDRRVVALTREERTRGIAKVRADALREFAAKDIPAAVEARRTLLAEADRIEQEARDGE